MTLSPLKKIEKKLLPNNIFSLYRIREWFHFLGLPVLGYFSQPESYSFPFLILLLGITFLLGCFSYSLNEIFDRSLPPKYMRVVLLPFLILIPSFWALNTLFRRVVLGILLGIAILYSSPYPSLKSHPFVGTLINAGGFPLLFILGVPYLNKTTLVFYLYFFFLMATAQLIHEMAHKEEDKKRKICTTAIFLGRKTKPLIIILFLFATSLAFLINRILGILNAGIWIHLLFLIRGDNFKLIRKVYRREGILLGLFLGGWLVFRRYLLV